MDDIQMPNADHERPWYDRRKPEDSPMAHCVDQTPAQAWAEGWNAAVKECKRQQDAIFAREMGTQSGSDAITWRHKDDTVRVDHMDAQEGDYYGPERWRQSGSTNTGVEYGALVEGYILGQKERVEKEQPKKVVTSDFPLHPTTCQCNGRGWFVEDSHREQCDNWDCVGCEKSRVACTYQ